jgi:cytochrome c5
MLVNNIHQLKKHTKQYLKCLLTLALVTTCLNAFAIERSGKEIVGSVCSNCHANGKLGAPQIGDQAEWRKRASKGIDQLVNHAITGMRKMPAHGGQSELTDLEMSRAVVFMATNGQGLEPNKPLNSSKALSGALVVQERCQQCHVAGKNGAPKIGDMVAWKPRLSNGIANLVQSSIKGHNLMQSRGGLPSLSDIEMKNAVEYMVSQTGAMTIKESHEN